MKNLNLLFLFFLLIIFFIGLYLYTFNLFFKNTCSIESFDQTNESSSDECPNLLINKGHVILLYNTKQPEEDGKNPIPFKNLDEYIIYLETQRKNGIKCPVLYLQQENDAQGKDVFRIRPSPFDLQGGNPPIQLTRSEMNHQDKQIGEPPNLLMNSAGIISDPNNPVQIIDSNRKNPPYNSNNYAGFDPTNQYVGIYTNLDAIHDSTSFYNTSDNPMDSNWGGILYTENSVQSGKYEENNIVKPTYFNTTNTISYSNIIPNPSGLGPPDNYRT